MWTVAATVGFVLELASLGALAGWGWRAGRTVPARVTLALVAPGAWAAVWGGLLSPQPAIVLAPPAVLAGQLGMVAVAGLALLRGGHARLAAGLAATAVADQVLLLVLR